MGLNSHGHLNEWFAFMFLDGSSIVIVVYGSLLVVMMKFK